MQIVDISRTLRPGMPTWPGEPGPELTPLKQMSNGDTADVSHLALGVHTGTHVDAPCHFIAGGESVESLPLDVLIGPARVVDVRHPVAIGVDELHGAGLEGVERVLFRTRNSDEPASAAFSEEFVYLEPAAAEWLAAHGTRLVGVDYLSVEPFAAAEPLTHRTLLERGVVIVEGLDLSGIEPGDYFLSCLPLKLEGSDGAPARAVLMRDN